MKKNRGNLICDDLNKPSSKNTKPSEFENEKNRTHRWAILFLAVIATSVSYTHLTLPTILRV